ncbi:KpsF/GutQ family sugar-phosphate isomerase [Maribacter dokdonensis]|uniref:KpsF/GutQ family sugar-phosphate isomerase n=1 Tax=Maribacter dokdonensis TaxID=320912 RepID=UPI0007198C0F|nr:KpsF/GutQ family sugar-phosphate isomerase [Maribacter dokdonensis]MDP2526906.1 KpsF/GutQ family sugar-phosphate isomerase [Maribacter dokdonensis]
MNNRLIATDTIIGLAKKTIETERDAIAQLSSLLTDDFASIVNCIIQAKGRVIISGIGKSAIIATKIVATLNSTGTPAIFMHAGDAIHGDLGTVQDNDVVICISNSGNTPEIKMLVPLIKRGTNKLIAMTGNTDSFLAKQADYILNTHVEKEACPNGLAPTTSTTAQLVMGDALAIVLLEIKGFTSSDFAKYHPGGSLGKRLYLRVSDLVSKNQVPSVQQDEEVKKVIVEISKKMLGVTAVLDREKVVGIVTDGDIRRMLNKHDNIKGLTAKDIMTTNPKTISANTLAIKALEQMQKKGISQLLAMDNDTYIGVIHLHNLINEGIL